MIFKEKDPEAKCIFSMKEAGLTDFVGVVRNTDGAQPLLTPRL
jgi:hypothetical protein